METTEKIEAVLNHIQNVQRNCYKLGLKLIKVGEMEIGRNLIANGQIHDNSKFKGIEFKHLFHGDPLLKDVVEHHRAINPHHPEYWGHIFNMPSVYLAEMVCDCAARSAEFGTDIRVWFAGPGAEKYGYKQHDEVWRKIFKYLDMLLEQPFEKK